VVRRGGQVAPAAAAASVVTTEEVTGMPLAGVDPAVYPGRQLSKAEAEEMGLTPVETVDEYRQE
jgi:hypothetical protein